jgi:hypothetical protein
MRRAMIGPYQIFERREQFEVRKGGTILSRHDTYLDAEDAALRAWLHGHDDEERDATPPAILRP